MAPNLWLRIACCAALTIIAVNGTPARRGKKQQQNSGPVTCPGFAGYCSESYPGQTCLVVCARGRNNVPECQDDGTWTDEPRCIEHEPGIQEQVPGICPGIPGYCSLDTPGGLCTFECPIGPKIRSTCTPDGTWEPYPTCQGDPRETQDGCDPCPGPFGGPRNRTAEAGGGSGGSRVNTIGGGSNGKRPGNNNNNRQQSGGNRGGNNGNNRHGAAQNNRGGNNRNNGGGGNRASGNNRNAGHGQKNNNNRNGGFQQNKNNRNGGNNRKQQQQRPAANKNHGGGGSSNNRRQGGGGASCPGEVLQACIDVCPGFSARIFGACVAGCAKRCPGKK